MLRQARVDRQPLSQQRLATVEIYRAGARPGHGWFVVVEARAVVSCSKNLKLTDDSGKPGRNRLLNNHALEW